MKKEKLPMKYQTDIWCGTCGSLLPSSKASCVHCIQKKKDAENNTSEKFKKFTKTMPMNCIPCSGCGGLMRSDTGYTLCFECRREKSPEGQAEKDYDETYGENAK